MEKSTPWFGRNTEHAFVAYERTFPPEKAGELIVIEFGDDLRGHVDVEIGGMKNMTPIVVYHTHPFYPAFDGAFNPWAISFGPSALDGQTASKFPNVHFVVDDLTFRYYFGQKMR